MPKNYSSSSPAPTTGKILEREYFGEVDISKKKAQLAIQTFMQLSGGKRPAETDYYLPFEKSIRFAKAFQPWPDPTTPSKKVARDLMDYICEELNLDPEGKEAENLKFYTAVGSPLDVRHGVDAFLEYNGRRILIDLTKNPAKRFDDSAGDRMIMEELPDWTDKQQANLYKEQMRKYASYCAAVLQPREHTREITTVRVPIR